MSEAKPFASLSPTLLARKGAAKPAMRPQWQPLSNYSTEVPLPPQGLEHDGLEDLGWNDMGHEHDEFEAFAAAPDPTVVPFGAPDEALVQTPLTAGPPEVVRQRDTLAEQVSEPPALIPLAAHRYARATAAAAAQHERRSALADGRRAAFTLRVDESRHLKLRLACTVQGRSAQQIVTEALDRLLDELPGLDDLAKRAKRR